MISLNEGKILGKSAPEEPVSFSFEKGLVNYISSSESYKFKFLKLKDQALESGTLIIDGITIYPNEDNDHSLFFMTVNSLIRIHLCFVCETKTKKDKVKEVQDSLIRLRDLPVDTEEQKANKISGIFLTVNQLQPSYLLIDLNDEDNKKFDSLKSELEKYQESMLIIALEKTEESDTEIAESSDDVIGEEETFELSIGKPIQAPVSEKRSQKPISVKAKDSKSFKNTFVAMFKENIMAFLSFIAPSLGVIVFALLSPLYAQTNKTLLIPFIITMVVCFSLYIVMTYKCTDFENRNQLISYAILSSCSLIIAYGLSFGIYMLFANFNPDIKEKALQSKNVTGIVVSIILALVLMSLFLYVRPIGKAIVKLFKKKK